MKQAVNLTTIFLAGSVSGLLPASVLFYFQCSREAYETIANYTLLVLVLLGCSATASMILGAPSWIKRKSHKRLA